MSSKKFVLQFDFEGNIGPIKSSVEDLQKSLKGIKLPDNIGTGLEKTFSRLAAEFDNFEAIVKTGFDDLGNISKAERSFGKISALVSQLSVQAGSLTGVDPKKLIPQESLDRLKGLEKAWIDVKKESEKKSNLDKEIEKQTGEIEEQEKALKKLTDQYDKLAAKNKALGSQKGALTNSKNAKENRRNDVLTQMTALEGQKGGKSSAEYKALNQEYTQLSQSIRGLETDIRNIDKEINNNKVEMAGLNTQISSSTEAYEKMRAQLTNLKNTQITPKGLVELRTEIAKLTDLNISEVPTDLEELQKTINSLTEKQLEEVAKSLAEIKTNGDALPGSLIPAKESVKGLGEAGQEVTRTASEIENLKNQVLQFFSLTNSVQLFKRAVTSALNTVKELDATMTEAAVVTEFDVGDMWEKLPQYSKEAQNLGVSINGMYQATTLYYQQGLKNQEAMELGIETMKMGKIAAMDSTEATKAMTAALRGFNMELNETSATRVNDVYSQLAAVTAADTNQIATAMEKTASIAASANMEFETTAAFLAQIIETTQEAPETAGTALKTIIARFAEVKSLRDQGLTSGEDEEGEIIDVNKIQTALRSVGISMEGFFSGKEGLDSVLLKLAEKWGTLDFETQRYIATMAAGSRQQSRFIAMMSDYSRTTELVGEAQNSAGASQDQFNKTLDSMETKLQKLENAWKQFLMGLANNEILKAGVDGLTKILETVNKITDGISGGNGLIKSIVSLAGVLATLKGGKALLSGTAVGGAMSGLIGKLAGGKGGEVSNKSTIFSVPEGFGPNETKGVGKAKRAELRANAKQRLKQTFKVQKTEEVVKYDKKAMQKRIGQSYNSVTPEQQKGLVELGKQLKNNEISAEGAAEKMKILGIETDNLSEISQQTSLDFNAMGQAANTAGMAMMAAGAAASLLASAFESWGMEEEAEAMQTLSGVLMTLGPILMGIGSFLPTLTSLTAAQAAATWAALWPILLVVAALGALVAVIVLVAKALHEASLEGRMEAAAEATERAKEAADGAKQAYDDLLSAKSGYNELQNKLDELTKGTLEWKQALADSNAQVLELLDKYPELAKHLTRGKHGELEVTEAGWDYVEEQQQQAVQNTNAAVIASQMDETRLKNEQALEQLFKAGKEEGITKRVRSGLRKSHAVADTADIQAIYDKYKEMPDFFESDQVEGFAKSIGQTKDEVLAMKDAILKYDQALAENEVLLQAQAEALLANNASAETNEYEYGDEIIAGFAQGAVKNQEKNEQAIQEQLAVSKNESVKDSTKFQEMARAAKVQDIELTGDNVHDLEVLYAKMAGISTEEIAEGLKGNQEKLIEKISKMQATKETSVKVDEVAKKMSAIEDKNTQKEYAAMLGGNTDLMNKKIIGNYLDTTDEDIGQIAKDLGLTKEELAANMGVSVEDLVTKFEELANSANDAFIVAETKIRDITGTDAIPEAFNQASAGDLESYAQLLGQAVTLGSQDVISEGFNNIFKTVTAEQKEKIVDMMDTFDWTKEGAGEEFIETLKQMGIDIEKIIPNGKDFCEQLKTANALYRDFDLTSIFDAVEKGMKEAEEIAEQSELTTEQYQKFLNKGLVNADQWTFNGKGWVNVENGMKDLVEALKANTIATFQQAQKEAQAQVDLYDKVNPQINAYLNLSTTHQSNIELIQSGQAGGRLLEDVGVTQDEYKVWYDLNQNGAAGYNTAKSLANANINWGATGGGGGGGSASKYENNYDRLHNTLEKINDTLRERERLERRYQRLVERGTKSAVDIQGAREAQLANLEQEIALQEQIIAGRNQQIDELLAKNSSLQKYVQVENLDNGERTIRIDWSAIDQVTNSTKGENIDKFYDDLKEYLESIYDAEQTIADNQDAQYDLLQEGEDEYFDIEEQIKEAIIAERQEEIDKLSDINDSINNTNSRLLESMQEQINEYRRNRENAKTEEEIGDKQRRLAYLQMDTSGANATEILQLQKEIDEAQEDYTDTLIDQKISELQKQNDQAAEQRQRQIDILQSQLEYDENNGVIWERVKALMDEGLDPEKGLIRGSQLATLLKSAAGFEGMSDLEQMKWLKNLEGNIAKAVAWLDAGAFQSLHSKGDKVEFVNKDGQRITGTVNEDGDVVTKEGYIYSGKNISMGADGSLISSQSMKDIKQKTAPVPESLPQQSTPQSTGYWAYGLTKQEVKKLQADLNRLGYNAGEVDGIYGQGTTAAVKRFQQASNLVADGIAGKLTLSALEKTIVRIRGLSTQGLREEKFRKYETGGLADFTGPAWLDGTKSRPEYVLSANQTEAFFTLVDVLGSLQTKPLQSTQNNGDNTFDIDINVESIGSDYDVEQIAETVKRLINDDARYRNNNTVNLMR